MPMTGDDGTKLMDAGFTLVEINEFARAKTPNKEDQAYIDLNDKTWIEAMENRRRWVNELSNQGFTKSQIDEAITFFFTKHDDASPWDFLKEAYKPPDKPAFRKTINATQRVRRWENAITKSMKKETIQTHRERTRHGGRGNRNYREEGSLGDTIYNLNHNNRI